jgi:DNA-binding IclR family transcriptional regulator
MASSLAVTSPMEFDRAAAGARDQYRIQCLNRAIQLLDLVGECDDLPTLATVCQYTGLHKSTAHRLLMVLERSGMIERTEDNRFRLGMKLYELGIRALDQVDLRARVRPHFRRLSAQVRETIHLGVLQKASVVYLEKMDPNARSVCPGSSTGSSNPVYCTAMGKAMLAYLPPEAADTVIAGIRFRRFTPNTLGSECELREALERIRRRGYAVDDEEIEEGVRCIGAPIFSAGGIPIAAVSVSGPVARITSLRASGIAECLLRCCRDISGSLGRDRRRLHTVTPFPESMPATSAVPRLVT